MAQTLSLSHVRESSHFAWHPLGYLWVDGELFRAVRMEPPAAEGYQGVLSIKQSSLRDDLRILEDGWRHADGCSCELCALEVVADLGVPAESAATRA
jgi:hypothetical protein